MRSGCNLPESLFHLVLSAFFCNCIKKKKHCHAEKIYYDDEVLLILGHPHREIYYIQKKYEE